MHGIGFKPDVVEVTELRERLQKMSEAELLAFGKDAKYMCSPRAYFGKPPRQCFVIQLREAKAEWRRRQESGLASSSGPNLLKEELMDKVKPVCPEHKMEMDFPTSNIDQSEKLILHGRQIRNMFHYCRECNWRYSSDLGEYFEATELPASQPKTSRLL